VTAFVAILVPPPYLADHIRGRRAGPGGARSVVELVVVPARYACGRPVTLALSEDFVVLTPHLRGFRFRARLTKIATVSGDLRIRPDDPDPRLWFAAWAVHLSRATKR
jgi:hypothetical protein